MAGEPTLRPGDESIDGWVEYLQTQLVNLAGGINGIPEVWDPTGVFDDDTERYVRAFQEHNSLLVDGIVGTETWNMLHGNLDTEDPGTDGRAPGTYVEETPRLEWETDADFDAATHAYTWTAINVGSTDIASVTVAVRVLSGPEVVHGDSADGWTDDGEAVPPGGRMRFTVFLERDLQIEEDVEIELELPAENGGAIHRPACSGYLEAMLRGEV